MGEWKETSMARLHGSGKEYQQAKKTVAKLLLVEGLVEENVLDAVKKMADILQNTKAPIAIQLSAAKFFIEAHAKFAKGHGKNPKPADFVVDKTVEVTEVEEEENVISMKFKG